MQSIWFGALGLLFILGPSFSLVSLTVIAPSLSSLLEW